MIVIHKLFNTYEIEVDESQFTVRKPSNITTDKDGNSVQNYKTIGFFISLEQAILRIVKLLMIENNEDKTIDLQEYIDQYKAIVNELKPFA
jgi:hypothetical protein